MNVDFHMHSNNSDGHFSTAELLELCEDNNLKIISITDHDSVQSYYDVLSDNLSFNGILVNGVELSFASNGGLFDILGYGININKMNNWLQSTYNHEKMLQKQRRILSVMQQLYDELGIKYAPNLKIRTGFKSEAYNLVKQSALTFEENRDKFPELFGKSFYKVCHTNKNSKYYIDETYLCPTIHEVIDAIHSAGGVAILAHSGDYNFSETEMRTYIEEAIKAGIDGLELKHNSHSSKIEEIIQEYAQRHRLLTSGGSDYHGGNIKKNVKLGKVYGGVPIDGKSITPFIKRLSEIPSSTTRPHLTV